MDDRLFGKMLPRNGEKERAAPTEVYSPYEYKNRVRYIHTWPAADRVP